MSRVSFGRSTICWELSVLEMVSFSVWIKPASEVTVMASAEVLGASLASTRLTSPPTRSTSTISATLKPVADTSTLYRPYFSSGAS